MAAKKNSPQDRAVKAFEARKKKPPKPIDNADLYAGSPMTYYCRHCRHVSEVLPESHTSRPSHVCGDCRVLIEKGWMPSDQEEGS